MVHCWAKACPNKKQGMAENYNNVSVIDIVMLRWPGAFMTGFVVSVADSKPVLYQCLFSYKFKDCISIKFKHNEEVQFPHMLTS